MKNKKFVIKNTLGMFDLLKGIVMILVVVSHTAGLIPFLDEYHSIDELVANVNIFVLFLTFAFMIFGQATMPALFIISGYGFRKTTYKKCIVKQYETLIIPYIITVVIATILHFFSYYFLYGGFKISLKQTIQILLGGLFGFPTNRGINDFWLLACGPIWFLAALSIATFIFNFWVNNFSGVKLFLLSLLTTVIGWIISFAGPLPWSLSQAFIAVSYLWLGYYIKKNKLLVSPIKIKHAIGIAIIVIPYLFYTNFSKFFGMATDEYPLGPISIIANGLLGVLIIKFFLHLNSFDGFICTFIRKIGRQSLYFLCIHSIEMVAIGNYLTYLFIYEWWKGDPGLRSIIILAIRIPFAIIATFLFVYIKDNIAKARKA
ncbi:acyltransferase family protein [Butyrivibrio sp. WCD2001]|uniref:acyltransferase family protein n=1 Tax=Butyrivibrio sp. WCD2001 TaxID=1280681 RepID=UPI00041A375B|nr:acyltransferase [Butyrivibrio sp. WCD2001]